MLIVLSKRTLLEDDMGIVDEIRHLRREHVHGMRGEGAAGVAPHLLMQELGQRISEIDLLEQLHVARAAGDILIIGKKALYEGRGSLTVIEVSLNSSFLKNERGRWNIVVNGEEACFNQLRIYVVADRLPQSIAKQGVVKRAIARIR